MDKPRMLQRGSGTEYTSKSGNISIEGCANELMNAAVSFHKLHLKLKGPGSFAAHLALNDLYDALPDHADKLVESFQGAAGRLLDIPDSTPKRLDSVEEAISYLQTLHTMVTTLQGTLEYSEIINDLDNVKSSIDSDKYKLTFLK
jgi:DNA-binding ferritin-like protein